VVKRFFRRRKPAPASPPKPEREAARLEATRGRILVEESRELVLVLDDEDRVLGASRRARETIEGLEEGAPAPASLLREDDAQTTFAIPYEVGGRWEKLLYVRDAGDLAAYEELRAGFTAAVSHELRTPLARLLALLETALLVGEDPKELIEQARAEVGQIGELIDDILFLSELESGRELVALGSTRALPLLVEVAEGLEERAARAGMTISVEGDDDAELPLRPRMIRVVAFNLASNAISYAGPGAHLTLSVLQEDDQVVLSATDSGAGVDEVHLPRLFERFYRADRARSSRGTGLGLAIVKHVVSSADGTVEASGGRGVGLTIRCAFPAADGRADPRSA
jgi:two-component system phosphate regulon sensor histidine kinase PhoR